MRVGRASPIIPGPRVSSLRGFSTNEDLCSHPRRPPARLVRRRCRGADARPARHTHRRCPAGQAQAGVHAACRHRRLHRRRQRGEDPRHRQQARAEDILAPQRLPRRNQVAQSGRDARAPARGGHPQGGEGDAAAQPPRPPAADQAQGLCRSRPPARRPAAKADGNREMTDDEKKETSEDATPEETPAEEPQADATEETPAEEPQADATEETPSEEPQADATEEAPAEEAAVDAEAPPAADDDRSLTPSEEAEAPGAEAESPTEEPAAESPTEQPAEEQSATEPAAEKKSEKKKDVIPGADLEPIAVESGEERPLSAEERARREAEEEERAQREAALAGAGEEDPGPASRAPAKMESGSRFQATGKRKRSIARVTLLPGEGKFEINGRSIEEFFPRPLHQTMARQPLATTGYETSVDVRIRVHGGGIGGQAGAVRHGISRALTEIDPELRGELKRRGFLTRDARVKERRKAGLKKARKRPQFSKR